MISQIVEVAFSVDVVERSLAGLDCVQQLTRGPIVFFSEEYRDMAMVAGLSLRSSSLIGVSPNLFEESCVKTP